MLDVINEGDVSFGVFVATRSSVRRSLANRVLNYASTHGLAAVKSAEVLWPIADDPGLNPLLARNALKRKGTGASNRGGHRNYSGSAHSASTDHQGCGQPRPSIHRRQNADTGPAELRSCPRDGVVPAAIAIKARSYDMGPELQLRYRTAVTMPCVPDLDTDRVQSIAAALPAVMWPTWSERLLPDLRCTAVARTTLSCATLLRAVK